MGKAPILVVSLLGYCMFLLDSEPAYQSPEPNGMCERRASFNTIRKCQFMPVGTAKYLCVMAGLGWFCIVRCLQLYLTTVYFFCVKAVLLPG